jgi:signal transduction histidine kinase
VKSPDIGSFLADGKRVVQILYNLLSNAIGFSSPGQTITVAALRREGEVVFKVIDEGRGIPKEIIDKVFDRFNSNKVGSNHTGAGLGLAIVRSFLELHGGKVLIDSVLGQGTTVTCIFPAPRAHSREQIQDSLRRHGLGKDA